MKRLIMLVVVLAMVSGCASQQLNRSRNDGVLTQHEVNKMNSIFTKEMAGINSVSQKHYGVDTLHYMKAHVGGNMVINYTHQAFQFSTQSVEKQIDVLIDQFKAQLGREMSAVGIYTITILIDGNFNSVHTL